MEMLKIFEIFLKGKNDQKISHTFERAFQRYLANYES
jgi:hypothetical protein